MLTYGEIISTIAVVISIARFVFEATPLGDRLAA
jgi:hypothetical protein